MTRSATPSTASTGKTSAGKAAATQATPRHDRIADAALTLLAERGLRGLTHRAVDEAAGLPQGSTSNLARTRAALLETAVRRLAEREAAILTPPEMPDAAGSGPAALADALSLGLHRSLTRHRDLTVARYELALEATRRPELRAFYDRAGQRFREALVAMLTAAGSTAPERHTLNVLAWCDGMLFTCVAGQFHATPPTRRELRTGIEELLVGLLGRG
ncbi:TetR family transcriptional regulator [Streptomyces sp. NRRL F-5755]|uniref:TetR/AcrR family transcriptional regulator n=1 Tax=Streptomyces sp. NRRL F-5755 TaxID=1519475 RepID=UPI0006B03631|nr:TetR/AcrR family transcriptional regulator [Streptomyces sp. NRRL F-5755]KOT86193.1 TetR family transcriptional regulator [Streptomyces sp. NRRL F-5755]